MLSVFSLPVYKSIYIYGPKLSATCCVLGPPNRGRKLWSRWQAPVTWTWSPSSSIFSLSSTGWKSRMPGIRLAGLKSVLSRNWLKLRSGCRISIRSSKRSEWKARSLTGTTLPTLRTKLLPNRCVRFFISLPPPTPPPTSSVCLSPSPPPSLSSLWCHRKTDGAIANKTLSGSYYIHRQNWLIPLPNLINPFTAPAYKISEAEWCTDVPAKSIFSGARTFIFSAMPFDENPFTWQCEKEDKKAKGLKLCTFICRFQVTSWQWGG